MSEVPAAGPTRLDPEEAAAVQAAVARVLESGPWIGGPEVDGFERRFADQLELGDVVGVGNGTDALAVAFTALGLPAGSGVLVADNEGGYASTAARMAGLEPVVMDVDEATMAPSARDAESALRPHVSAIVVTHLHGETVGLGELDRWRRDRGLLLIEDCAQVHGGSREGVRAGTVGDAATFSFYPTKNLGAIGDGGAVAFRDPELAERARGLREYGWRARYRVELAAGRNSRLDPLQAAVLSARLPHLDRRNERRRVIHAAYRQALLGTGIALHGDAGSTVAHHAVVVSPQRDALARHLADRGIRTAVHYPFLVSEMPGLGVAPADTPVAAKLRDRILSLPCFPELTDAEVARVADALAEWRSPE